MKHICMPSNRGIILAILLAVSLPVIAQRSLPKNMVMADYQKFHFGYSVGFNLTGFTAIPKDGYHLDLLQNPGININLITNLRLGKFLDLRFLPGIQFSQRDLTITNKVSAETRTWRIESVYVDMPFLLKYRAERINNYAPYLIAGIAPRFDLVRSELVGWKPATPMLQSFDFYPELGVGFDFYLSMVTVAMELKFSVGMLDVFKGPADPEFNLYVTGIDRIYSRMVVLAFHVEQSR
jgi:uncharacterized membrane protein YjgN (DUF898 family)